MHGQGRPLVLIHSLPGHARPLTICKWAYLLDTHVVIILPSILRFWDSFAGWTYLKGYRA
jgi:hypothetical protein